MNRTKRKIFETSMDLFAKKGYDSTSIEEITSVVGIAKGTLYYHFSSKGEILDFLIVEGLKLLEHSLEIKTRNLETIKEKIDAILLVELKVVDKYENLISLIMKEICGNEDRNKKCRESVYSCVDVIEKIIKEYIVKGEIKQCNTREIAFEIFGIICSGILIRYENNGSIDINKMANQYSQAILKGIEII